MFPGKSPIPESWLVENVTNLVQMLMTVVFKCSVVFEMQGRHSPSAWSSVGAWLQYTSVLIWYWSCVGSKWTPYQKLAIYYSCMCQWWFMRTFLQWLFSVMKYLYHGKWLGVSRYKYKTQVYTSYTNCQGLRKWFKLFKKNQMY